MPTSPRWPSPTRRRGSSPRPARRCGSACRPAPCRLRPTSRARPSSHPGQPKLGARGRSSRRRSPCSSRTTTGSRGRRRRRVERWRSIPAIATPPQPCCRRAPPTGAGPRRRRRCGRRCAGTRKSLDLASMLAHLLEQVGRWLDALGGDRRLVAREPLFVAGHVGLTWALWGAGDLIASEAASDRAHALWPGHVWLWEQRFTLLALGGRASKALALASDRSARPVESPRQVRRPFEMYVAVARALEKRVPANVAAAINAVLHTRAQGRVPSWAAAMYLAALGQPDHAFELLNYYYFGVGGARTSAPDRGRSASARRARSSSHRWRHCAPTRASPRSPAGLASTITGARPIPAPTTAPDRAHPSTKSALHQASIRPSMWRPASSCRLIARAWTGKPSGQGQLLGGRDRHEKTGLAACSGRVLSRHACDARPCRRAARSPSSSSGGEALPSVTISYRDLDLGAPEGGADAPLAGPGRGLSAVQACPRLHRVRLDGRAAQVRAGRHKARRARSRARSRGSGASTSPLQETPPSRRAERLPRHARRSATGHRATSTGRFV